MEHWALRNWKKQEFESVRLEDQIVVMRLAVGSLTD
jgi:hypothetical protein